MKEISSTAKPVVVYSTNLMLNGRRRILSMMAIKMCPPSSTGMGSKLMIARLMLSITRKLKARR